jgi:hypothetical protein
MKTPAKGEGAVQPAPPTRAQRFSQRVLLLAVVSKYQRKGIGVRQVRTALSRTATHCHPRSKESLMRARTETAILAHVDQREWALLQAQEEREKRNVFDLIKRLEEDAA